MNLEQAVDQARASDNEMIEAMKARAPSEAVAMVTAGMTTLLTHIGTIRSITLASSRDPILRATAEITIDQLQFGVATILAGFIQSLPEEKQETTSNFITSNAETIYKNRMQRSKIAGNVVEQLLRDAGDKNNG